MKIVVTGGAGQLGRALTRRARAAHFDVIAADRNVLDVRAPSAVSRILKRERPFVVINAAAFTEVDKAETQPDLAFAINSSGAGNVARVCADLGIRLLHVSTDYVFDGTAASPYREDSPVHPLGAYGASKAQGEELVRAEGGVVVRTSWLFEERGPSFVHTIFRLAAERRVLRVVNDQWGRPTWADDLADVLLSLGRQSRLEPTYHVCNEGITTWHGFALAIVELAAKQQHIACKQIEAISTAEYPTAARRPAYSVLDTQRVRALGIALPSWRDGLMRVIASLSGAVVDPSGGA